MAHTQIKPPCPGILTTCYCSRKLFNVSLVFSLVDLKVSCTCLRNQKRYSYYVTEEKGETREVRGVSGTEGQWEKMLVVDCISGSRQVSDSADCAKYPADTALILIFSGDFLLKPSGKLSNHAIQVLHMLLLLPGNVLIFLLGPSVL